MPTNRKKTGRQNYDWSKIQHDYVTSPTMSLRKIAEKYHINYKTVAKKSKAEGWFATRKKCQSRMVSKAITKTTNQMANELAKESEFLEMMKGHMGRMLSDEDQFRRQFTTNMVTGESGETITNKYDARAMKDTMQSLKLIEEMTRSLYNLQKAEVIQRQQIENERLQLERERFEFEKQKADMMKPDTSAVIRIEGYEKGWDE